MKLVNTGILVLFVCWFLLTLLVAHLRVDTVGSVLLLSQLNILCVCLHVHVYVCVRVHLCVYFCVCAQLVGFARGYLDATTKKWRTWELSPLAVSIVKDYVKK